MVGKEKVVAEEVTGGVWRPIQKRQRNPEFRT